ncbi:MAG: SUMF1/EgtB/PvdO family nonheme iron enzyme [Candidatus Aminicenantes bacterium]|nr:SUMF1/EgtB/PvdO family nonheme iron enzyme [Candidatus Aminicenantes bacterium]
MANKSFRMKSFTAFVLVFFTVFLVSDVFPQNNNLQAKEIKRLINTGRIHYERGEYSEALVQLHEAKDLIEGMEPKERSSFNIEMSEIYFNLALTYYAVRDAERNRERCQEYINLWLKINPEKQIDELSYPRGFMEIFNRLKSESQKPDLISKPPAEKPEVKKPASKTVPKKTEEEEVEPTPEKKPIIRKKVSEAEQPAKKKKKTPWLVIGGAVVAAGTLAAVLLMGGPSTGNIQINSSPSGAKVCLDGIDTGQVTNCTLSNIEKGSHTIKLVKEGYGDYQKSVTVEGGKTESVNANLTANTINVTSPSEGEVWFKGQEVEIQWNTGGGISLNWSEETVQSTGQNSSRIDMLNSHSMRRMMKDLMFFGQSSRPHSVPEENLGSKDIMRSKEKSITFPSKTIKPSPIKKMRSFFDHRHMTDDILFPEKVLRQNILRNSGEKNSSLKSQNNPWQNIENDQPLAISSVNIELSQGGGLMKTISSSTPNDGSHIWTVPEDLSNAENYKVRVSCTAEDGVYGESAEFEITNFLNMIDWVEVPAGWFKMGDNFNEGGSDEQPVHDVYLNGYYVSKYEVTFEQYDMFCDAAGRIKPDDEGWGRGQRPVINVTWHDAKAFCDWLSDITGKDIHLPTEAQWEKAARGTDQRRYPWGNSDPNNNKANYNDNVGKTMPVGSYPAGVSPYGAHDMAGNVWEWCHDWYDSGYYSSSPSHNPQGPSSGSDRVSRGGSWCNYAYFLRSTYRNSDYLSSSLADVGFRLCQEK